MSRDETPRRKRDGDATRNRRDETRRDVTRETYTMTCQMNGMAGDGATGCRPGRCVSSASIGLAWTRPRPSPAFEPPRHRVVDGIKEAWRQTTCTLAPASAAVALLIDPNQALAILYARALSPCKLHARALPPCKKIVSRDRRHHHTSSPPHSSPNTSNTLNLSA